MNRRELFYAAAGLLAVFVTKAKRADAVPTSYEPAPTTFYIDHEVSKNYGDRYFYWSHTDLMPTDIEVGDRVVLLHNGNVEAIVCQISWNRCFMRDVYTETQAYLDDFYKVKTA